MNDKEKELWRVIDNVIKCCAITTLDGTLSITREEVLGKSRAENLVMTRCMVVEQMLHAGFSITTTAQVLNRTVQAVRHLQKLAFDYLKTSRVYRLATAQATLLNKIVLIIMFIFAKIKILMLWKYLMKYFKILLIILILVIV